jgi:hypothetical protein
MSTVNYATVRQTNFIKDKIFNLEKANVDLANRLAEQTKELARIEDICHQVQEVVSKVNQMYNDFFTPAERARLRSARNIKGLGI